MTTITYPSRELPGLSSAVVEVSGGRESLHVPGTPRAGRPQCQGGFAPTVVTVEKCAPDRTAEGSLAEIRETRLTTRVIPSWESEERT